MEEVHVWIRSAQPRLATADASHGGSRALESQLGRNQVRLVSPSMPLVTPIFASFPQALQQEIREMQIIVNRLNHDVVDLTQNADDNLSRRLRDEMQRLNESWSHIISSTKVFSQNIQVSDEETRRCGNEFGLSFRMP